MESCEVCCCEVEKYKCPACQLKYCSVKCFKIHKDSSCIVKASSMQQENLEDGEISENVSGDIVTHTTPSTEFQFDDECMTEDQVPVDRLEALGKDEQLLTCLGNPHLRAMLSGLDAEMQQGRAPTAIHAAMMEPIFLEFVDRCLHVVDSKEE